MRSQVAFLLLAAACGSSSSTPSPDAATGPAPRPDCNALGGLDCVLPLPASVYERDDPGSPTGVRLDLAAGTLPTSNRGASVDVAYFNGRDGFSADAPILVAFPEGVDPTSLPPITDPGKSLEASSPTVIVDLTTMQRVPHFAELDAQTTDPTYQALMIRPVVRLTEKHRYAVGITTALHAKAGGTIAISAGFSALLNGTPSGNPRLERARPRYPAVFAALAAAGVPKANLVLAWDFTVASDASIRADLLGARDVALAAMGEAGANLTFSVNVDTAGDDPTLIARYLEGKFDVPQVLTGDGGDDSTLARAADGKPMITGTYQAKFYAEVPICAAARKPVPVIIYGHGLLGSGDEITAHHLEYLANNLCAIIIATDWKGMASADLGSVAAALINFNAFPKVVDHLVQGMVDFIALEQIVRGPMAASPTFAGLIDPSRVYYYGNSQGGIYGGTFMAYDPVVTRGILGVPGANYALLLERSADWPNYHALQRNAYPDPIDGQLLLFLYQMDWDRVDPITTTAGLLGKNGDAVPGTPAKQILMIEARNDSQVPNIGTETEARTMGIPLLAPPVVTPYGLTAVDGPQASALTIIDEHKEPAPPLDNTSLDDNGTHGSVRQRAAVQEQMKEFLQNGRIVQTCHDREGTPVACDCPGDAVCGAHI